MMEFITSVVEGLWSDQVLDLIVGDTPYCFENVADFNRKLPFHRGKTLIPQFSVQIITSFLKRIGLPQDMLADFAKMNVLLRPDLHENPEELDRIEWMLTNHDVRVPLKLLLKAAMNACELHPCGNGYPRDQIQTIVQNACNPSAEYVAFQEAELQESKKGLKQMRQMMRTQAAELRVQAVVERLSRGERRLGRSIIEEVKAPRSPAEESKVSSSTVGSFKSAWRQKMAQKSISGGSGSYSKPNQESFKVDFTDTFKSTTQHDMSRRSLGGGSGSSSTGKPMQESFKVAFTETFRGVQDFGVPYEDGDVAWLDIFCLELLDAWFQQHSVIQAQMAHAFDEFDEVLSF